ncbi:MAG: nitroreductase family protein [Thermoleophilia bacterium]|nr:nitroreductase family protein [Thermoleophilia bacterium]
MEFRDLLPRRRMVRNYLPEPLPREVLERIVETVRRAPSAGYSQGQRLVVVTDDAVRLAIAEAIHEPDRVADGFEPWVQSAPALVVVCTREDDYHDRYRQADKLDEQGREIDWPVPYWHFDAGAAAMLVLLTAVDEGLAAGLFGVFAELEPVLREHLAIPDDVTPVAVVTLGRPAADPRWSAVTSRATRPRRPLTQLVHWERWGGRRER